jgi:DNA-binding response OmpR family regulator
MIPSRDGGWLEATLNDWGYDVVLAADGREALRAFEAPDAPSLAILDWVMPELDGPEVCRRLRLLPGGESRYILLLTARTGTENLVGGLESGADDFLTKPFERDELRARLHVGERIVELHRGLADRVAELEAALAEVDTLRGLLPICSYCKRIREGEAYTKSVEAYLAEHSEAKFSHGVCPECYEKYVTPRLEEL